MNDMQPAMPKAHLQLTTDDPGIEMVSQHGCTVHTGPGATLRRRTLEPHTPEKEWHVLLK